MELSDEEIGAILEQSEVAPEEFLHVLKASGVEPTGNAVNDVRTLAEQHGLEVETLLYGFFGEDSPLFADAVAAIEAEEAWDELPEED